MRPDKAPEGGKFRATAAAALDGVVGAWGDADMLCVKLDAAGALVVTTAGTCDGVIWTKEGRKSFTPTNNAVIGGKKYTVFKFAEFVDADTAASPALTAGLVLYATAAGDVTSTPAAGDIKVGTVLAGGGRLLIDVSQKPAP